MPSEWPGFPGQGTEGSRSIRLSVTSGYTLDILEPDNGVRKLTMGALVGPLT